MSLCLNVLCHIGVILTSISSSSAKQCDFKRGLPPEGRSQVAYDSSEGAASFCVEINGAAHRADAATYHEVKSPVRPLNLLLVDGRISHMPFVIGTYSI